MLNGTMNNLESHRLILTSWLHTNMSPTQTDDCNHCLSKLTLRNRDRGDQFRIQQPTNYVTAESRI